MIVHLLLGATVVSSFLDGHLSMAPSLSRSSHFSCSHRISLNPVCLAKKKKSGGGKKSQKGNNKKSGFEWASTFETKPTESAAMREITELAVSSFRTRTGKILDEKLSMANDIPKALWSADTAVLVIGPPATSELEQDEDGSEGTVLYANLAACEACGVGAEWNKLIGSKSELPATMSEKKYQASYQKKLRSAGVLLKPETCSRWSLEKMALSDGKLSVQTIGIAYSFGEWWKEDGTCCKPGGVQIAPAMDPAEVEAALEAQAAEVRRLKEEQGLTNKDPEVMAAVAELLRLKQAAQPPED